MRTVYSDDSFNSCSILFLYGVCIFSDTNYCKYDRATLSYNIWDGSYL